jgi:hypothetical protein
LKAARVPIEKITNYLLNLSHPDGGPKAQFFINGGFSGDRPELLALALLDHFRHNQSRSTQGS